MGRLPPGRAVHLFPFFEEYSTVSDIRFEPFHDRVLIRPIAMELRQGPIETPDSLKAAPQTGIVLASGPGRIAGSVIHSLSAQPGDRVLYSQFAGTEVTLPHTGETLKVLRDEEILGRFQEEFEVFQQRDEDQPDQAQFRPAGIQYYIDADGSPSCRAVPQSGSAEVLAALDSARAAAIQRSKGLSTPAEEEGDLV